MTIPNTAERQSRLQRLTRETKFAEEDYYPGAPTEEIRLRCEQRVNRFLDEVLDLLKRGTPKEDFISHAEKLDASFDDEDTEEREKVGDYIGDTMRILGIKYWNPANGPDPEERDREFGFRSDV